MTDHLDLHVSRTSVPDAGDQHWAFFCDAVFAPGDFQQRPRDKVPPIIRRNSDHWATTVEDMAQQFYFLTAPAAVVRKRLLIQGYSYLYVQDVWEQLREAHVGRWRKFRGKGDKQLELTATLSYQDWLALIRQHEKDSHFASVDGSSHWQSPLALLSQPRDILVRLAILCEALESAQVWLDCGFLYKDALETRTPHAIAQAEAGAPDEDPTGKIIVLTEGKSDSRIISRALRALYPEFADAYQFIDFEGFRIEGGASVLARMVKILAGARVQNRLLAIFDNDAAGMEAKASLGGVRFGPAVRLMALPDTPLATRYPTIGPDGLKTMNINGSGVGIELFLGRSSLRRGRTLQPVRWTQWNEKVQRYHGAIDDKSGAAEAFLTGIADGRRPARLRRAYPEMTMLLESIFGAFEDYPPSMAAIDDWQIRDKGADSETLENL
ncbi:hypothetical protein WBQ88_12070 [Sphingopyxis sp. CCNWLW253]|uniref:hypothetical protein n=1 Tax=unclassified Sphingopyxis TaxID=2614943 RepID=UPI003012DF81